MENTVYKIRRKSDGLCSKGGMTPKFSINGKTWSELSHLKIHIAQLNGNCGLPKNKHNQMPTSHDGQTIFRHVYENCDIVTFDVTESGLESILDILNFDD